jgi:hypothetical protein
MSGTGDCLEDLNKLKTILTQCVYEEKIRIKDSMSYKTEASIYSEAKSAKSNKSV